MKLEAPIPVKPEAMSTSGLLIKLAKIFSLSFNLDSHLSNQNKLVKCILSY